MQPLIDWELLEERATPHHSIQIYKVTDAEGRTFYKGWLDNGTWQEHEVLANVRGSLILLGSTA